MPLAKPQPPPGFQSQATQVQATGAWYGGNLVRWRNGLLEKWMGWERLFQNPFAAIIRRMHAWLDLSNSKNLMVGTDVGVQLVVQDTVYDLGVQTVALPGGYILETGPPATTTTFTVASGSTTVTVNTTTPLGVGVGTTFAFQLAVSIGNRIIAAGTSFKIKALVAGGFTFDMPLPATATSTTVYGVRLLTNDFANGITVTWPSHGLSAGSRVTFNQATKVQAGAVGIWEKVNFSAPAGTVVTVASVSDADHFTFAMGALGTGDGAGGTNHQVYEGCTASHPTSGTLTSTIGTVIGIGAPLPLGNPQTSSWFLANLGQDGLVVASGGPLQVYHPPIANGPFLHPVGVATAGASATAPQINNGMIVAMPQAQVILFGSEPIMGSGTIDPLLVRWSDAGTYDVYTAAITNQAGSYRLSRGSRIVGALQAPQATLLFTDTDVWVMSYVGPPLIYGFTIMGAGCGLVAPHAVGVLGQMTMWQSTRGFWQLAGGGVQPVRCSVWDYIFEDVDTLNINKCHAAPNSSTNELAFYFPSLAAAVALAGNLLLWSTEMWRLSAWARNGVTVQVYALFAALYLYEPQYRLSGWFDDSAFALVSWWDRDIQGTVTTLLYAPDGSGSIVNLQEDSSTGPHSLSQTISKRQERVTYTFSVFAHINSTRNLTLRAATSLGYAYATFDVIHGNLVVAGVTSPTLVLNATQILTDPVMATGIGGNGWMRYVMSFTSDNSDHLLMALDLTNGTQTSYTGVPPNGCLVWGAQLVEGLDPLAYQVTQGTQVQNEATHYAKVNIIEGGAWDSGVLTRSAWLDNSIWGTPLGADQNNLVQQHERGFDADDQPMSGVFAESGFFELGDGSAVMLLDEVHPDFKWFGRDGGVKVTLVAANYPEGPQHNFGPYSMTPTTQFFNPRVRARYVAIRYDWEPIKGFSARVGAVTYRLKPAGRRP